MNILEIYSKKLRNENYSERTIQMYCHYASKFFIDINVKDVYQLTIRELNDYIFKYNYSSISQQNQIISSLKKFYGVILNKKYIHLSKIVRPRKEKHLPKIIDKEFILDKISRIDNLKHKTIISLAYSTGMRVSEIINLKISDIDSKRMIINVYRAKGNKDRIVPLSQTILELLRKYYLYYKPKEYMFNGQNVKQYSSTSCNAIVKQYLGKEYHFHLLRHSCFTSLIENGTDCRIIQKIAGHSNIKTTEGYMQVSTNILSKVNLPI
jgi:site-specific recombinase XerD